MNRTNRAAIAQETVDIVAQGSYRLDGGSRIDIRQQVAACVTGTRLYTPDRTALLAEWGTSSRLQTVLEVRNETTLTAARRLVVDRRHADTLCLNFASAKNPGGGFLGGSQAQEESLARSSALYASLLTKPEYYNANRRCRSAFYTDHMILSPDVPVFRDDTGRLLAEPYPVSFLTAPAVNAGAVHASEPQQLARVRDAMAVRIAMLLGVAADAGYRHVVLGAWGCGVFRNKPREVAELFAAALLGEGRFAGAFNGVTFAVLDSTPTRSTIGPFLTYFGGDG